MLVFHGKAKGNGDLTPFARDLRRRQTPEEELLWQDLRRSKLKGLSFRRQHVIGPYIVDFICLRARLIVELDGGHHLQEPYL
jgi:very-short-patch-repair endonuclease